MTVSSVSLALSPGPWNGREGDHRSFDEHFQCSTAATSGRLQADVRQESHRQLEVRVGREVGESRPRAHDAGSLFRRERVEGGHEGGWNR